MDTTRLLLAFILLAYLLIGALYALKTPDWQVPDEPAHYNYIRQLAEEKRLPVLEMGDYDQDYVARLTTERFPPELSVKTVEYEDWQPPLYYVLATPFYLIFDGALTPLRLFSVLLGAGVVLLAYAVAATILPDRPLIALGTAAFVAFLPQHVAMMAGVNNDSLAELLIGITLWMTVRWIGVDAGRWTKDDERGPSRWLIGLGLVSGLGLVAKASFMPVVLTVGLAILIVWWRDADRTWGQLLRALATVFIPAALIAALWWWRNLTTYGGLDIYGMANHDAVVFEQPRTGWWIDTYGVGAWLERWVTFTFQSFWGQFGWMGVLMPTWLYQALALCSGVLMVGFLFWMRRERSNTPTQRPYGTRSLQLGILAGMVLFVLLVYVYYNYTFVQHQGRYLFPALVPIAFGVALSVDTWLGLLRWPDRLRPLVFALPYLALAALDLYALWRFILPALT